MRVSGVLFYLNPFLHTVYLARSKIVLQVLFYSTCIIRTPRTCLPYILSNCTVIDRYANKCFSADGIPECAPRLKVLFHLSDVSISYRIENSKKKKHSRLQEMSLNFYRTYGLHDIAASRSTGTDSRRTHKRLYATIGN